MVAIGGHLPFAMAGRRTTKASGERPQPTTRLPFLKSCIILRYTLSRTQVLVIGSSCTVLGGQSVLARLLYVSVKSLIASCVVHKHYQIHG
jgi:hypothetical protein